MMALGCQKCGHFVFKQKKKVEELINVMEDGTFKSIKPLKVIRDKFFYCENCGTEQFINHTIGGEALIDTTEENVTFEGVKNGS